MSVVHTLAASYVAQSALQAGRAAEIAAERKSTKYSGLSSSHIFIPVAVESLGPFADDVDPFITEICRKMTFRCGLLVLIRNIGHWTLPINWVSTFPVRSVQSRGKTLN